MIEGRPFAGLSPPPTTGLPPVYKNLSDPDGRYGSNSLFVFFIGKRGMSGPLLYA